MSIIKWAAATAVQTLLSTELDALANNARAVGGATIPNGTDRLLFADIELSVAFGVAPTIDSVIQMYFVPTIDGTNFADGSALVAPGVEALATNFILKNTTNAQRIIAAGVSIRPTTLLPIIVNLSGQAFPATGSTVRMIRYAYESV